MATKQAQTAAKLLAFGAREIAKRANERIFQLPNMRNDYYLRVGKNGRLRAGNELRATSVSLDIDRFVQILNEREMARLS